MRRAVRRYGLWLVLLAVLAVGVPVFGRFAPNRREPVYEGRKLARWLRGHPREYGPAVLAVGTNALPYLLAELQVTDPAWLRWAEERFRRLEMGPPWETARVHRYYARIALQGLDTNAVPALLQAVFARPMRLADGDLAREAAFALTWMASPEAQETVIERIAAAMRSPDAKERRNGLLAVSAGNLRGTGVTARVAALTRDPDPAVRAAAVRAAMHFAPDGRDVLPAIMERLADEHSAVRSIAANTIAGWRTNAVQAQPALQAAWEAEPTRPRGADGLDDFYPRALSPERVRKAIGDAMQ